MRLQDEQGGIDRKDFSSGRQSDIFRLPFLFIMAACVVAQLTMLKTSGATIFALTLLLLPGRKACAHWSMPEYRAPNCSKVDLRHDLFFAP